VPSRTAHAIAALYGHEDDTLLAWQRFCAQAAEVLRPQHDPERLTKALALALAPSATRCKLMAPVTAPTTSTAARHASTCSLC
jgi:hypothetical protein